MAISSGLRLLFLSTSVGPLGSGLGGGVELSLYNIAQEMVRWGHRVQIVAPTGSVLEPFSIIQIPGNLQVIAQSQERTEPISMPENSVLANMWEYARSCQGDYDLIVNFAYDWLPLYLTPFFQCPIAHLISMGSLSNALDQVVAQVAHLYPGTVGFHTHAQAESFELRNTPSVRYLSNGIDLSLYEFCDSPKSELAWLGRIAPEKGLADAIAVAEITNTPLKIMGKVQDENYWQQICRDYPNAPFEYLGFLPTKGMQEVLRHCKGLLMTHRWVEAFGNVAIEALACGVPVISYRRGGPAEIVQDGKTGFLVEPDNITGLVAAIARLDQVNRKDCRVYAESEFSLTALGDRFENWFRDITVAHQLLR